VGHPLPFFAKLALPFHRVSWYDAGEKYILFCINRGRSSSSMRYISTRGNIRDISFKDAVMMGLADDGGLLLPESIPRLTAGDIAALSKMAYPELAFRIISLFAGEIPSADLKQLVDR
jgi:hypothetical protein